MDMRAAKAITMISRESQKQIFIQELLDKGITETKDGTRIESLDYYSLRHELVIAKFREIDVESQSNKYF
jgi:hypothetical protein